MIADRSKGSRYYEVSDTFGPTIPFCWSCQARGIGKLAGPVLDSPIISGPWIPVLDISSLLFSSSRLLMKGTGHNKD